MSKTMTVELKEFLGLLKRVSLTKSRAANEVGILGLKGGFGSLEIGSTTLVFHAKGNWRGEISFPAVMLFALRKYPPTTDPVVITYEGDQLSLGSLRMVGTYRAAVAEKAIVPDDATFADVLYESRQLAASTTLSPAFRVKLRSAEKETGKRIANAAAELAPFGITQSDIRALLEVRFLERKKESK